METSAVALALAEMLLWYRLRGWVVEDRGTQAEYFFALSYYVSTAGNWRWGIFEASEARVLSARESFDEALRWKILLDHNSGHLLVGWGAECFDEIEFEICE